MASGTARFPYETDKGNFFFARTDDSPALANIRGALPSGSITENITFKVSKTASEVGASPRYVTLHLKAADESVDCLINPKNVTKKVVVLKPSTKITPGQEVTVNGRVWITGSMTDEKMR